jgi:hypothetical protein
MKRVCHLIAAIILGGSLLSNGCGAPPETTPTGSCLYFPETGHYLCDEFRDFFETRGGLEIFGYPISEAFIDPTHSDLRVQYFQRTRMEGHPYHAPPYDVQLGLLVDELGYAYPALPPEERPDPTDPAHQFFPETGHVVSHAFLSFFRENGGLEIFGYPRSEMLYEDGVVVQYFQRARMERHRDRPAGQQIALTNVGEMYVERFGIPRSYAARRPPPQRAERTRITSRRQRHRVLLPVVVARAGPGAPAPAVTAPSGRIRALDVTASVRYPITGRTGTQTVFIYVNDQQRQPVAGAEASLVVHYTSGDRTCVAKPTDGSGFTRCSFGIPSPPVGKRVVIDVTATHGDLVATTQTSFMPWW